MSLFLEKLILTEFKNYHFQSIDCQARLNCFVGRNGMGKTNLLDAIYYLCMGKSYFSVADPHIPHHDADFFRLEGRFSLHDQTEKIVAKVAPGRMKTIERNDVPYAKNAEHVGLLPVVFAAPDDTQLIVEGGENRRRFLDNTLAQIDAQYLQHLLTYNQVLKQRNAALKQMAETRSYNPDLLAVYDRQLTDPAHYIYQQRKKFVESFAPGLQQAHAVISGSRETVTCEYRSALSEYTMPELLKINADKDRFTARTSAGIHRDDLELSINDRAPRKFASQGQLKSFLLALKLAQHDVLKTEKNRAPILLLDDIFDKLDSERVTHLLRLLLESNYGQIFISDTHPERVAAIARQLDKNGAFFMIENGTATPL